MIHAEGALLLAAGAVLDDLAPEERAAYEAHRVDCSSCRRVELELDHVLADLALVVPERVPPADLLAGVRRALAAQTDAWVTAPTTSTSTRAPVLRAIAPPAVSPTPARSSVMPFRRPSRRPLYVALGLAAALGGVALGLGARTLTLQHDLDTVGVQVASLESALAQRGEAVTVAMNPSHVTVALHGDVIAPQAEAAVVFVPGQTTAYLVARNLPATPAGRGYQLWYADAAGVHPLQTVAFDGSGPFVAPMGIDLAGSAAVMITLEDAGGARGEPGPQVVFGEL